MRMPAMATGNITTEVIVCAVSMILHVSWTGLTHCLDDK
jgi:hypothetical protein